jgi:hypothetical protein
VPSARGGAEGVGWPRPGEGARGAFPPVQTGHDHFPPGEGAVNGSSYAFPPGGGDPAGLAPRGLGGFGGLGRLGGIGGGPELGGGPVGGGAFAQAAEAPQMAAPGGEMLAAGRPFGHIGGGPELGGGAGGGFLGPLPGGGALLEPRGGAFGAPARLPPRGAGGGGGGGGGGALPWLEEPPWLNGQQPGAATPPPSPSLPY